MNIALFITFLILFVLAIIHEVYRPNEIKKNYEQLKRDRVKKIQ